MTEESKPETVKINVASLENVNFAIIVISSLMVAIGVGLGGFFQQAIIISILGAFFVMVGVLMYIVMQFKKD
jgi:hypothetical protein